MPLADSFAVVGALIVVGTAAVVPVAPLPCCIVTVDKSVEDDHGLVDLMDSVETFSGRGDDELWGEVKVVVVVDVVMMVGSAPTTTTDLLPLAGNKGKPAVVEVPTGAPAPNGVVAGEFVVVGRCWPEGSSFRMSCVRMDLVDDGSADWLATGGAVAAVELARPKMLLGWPVLVSWPISLGRTVVVDVDVVLVELSSVELRSGFDWTALGGAKVVVLVLPVDVELLAAAG